MSQLSRELCLPACLGIGLALYAYNVLLVPRGEATHETAGKAAPLQTEPQPLKPQQADAQPIKLAPLKPKLKPKPAASPSPEVTGAIDRQAATGLKPLKPADDSKHTIVPETGPAASGALPSVPGIRVASAAPQAAPIQSPDATRWSPAVGYAPLVRTSKPGMADRQMMPPKAKRHRVVRRPYRRPNFSLVIGVGPRW